MNVVHISSGLGNQMLSYCELIALRYSNPDDEFCIETLVYEITECNSVICQWNGYELNRIFGINEINLKDVLSKNVYASVLEEVRKSEFWRKNFNYSQYIVNSLNRNGFSLINTKKNLEESLADMTGSYNNQKKSFKYIAYTVLRKIFKYTYIAYYIKRTIKKIFSKKLIQDCNDTKNLFKKTDGSIYTGQRLSFKLKGNNIELIDKLIRQIFIFPEIIDEKNLDMLYTLRNTESVAIHARRGDMLQFNGDCYKYGYFRRAIKYIRKHVKNPVFVFFCDPGSVEWCKENEKIFGLDFLKDTVYFVDWNLGAESYRDMQLMAECKHNIITSSTFGWWGAYLNTNPNKITCSPDVRINTTHYF